MKFVLQLALLSLTITSFAQSTQCSRALNEAEEAFEQGRLLSILDANQSPRFYNCLRNGGFTKEEEIRAHKLLTKAYLFTDNEEMAEEKLVDLLYSDKEHALSPEDPAELYFLYSKFKTEPIFRVAARIGANKSMPVVMQEFTTFQYDEDEKLYNENGNTTGLGLGFWGELLVEKHIKNGIEVLAGPQLRVATYEVEGNLIDPDLTYSVKNRSTMLRMPLLGRYNYGYSAKDAEGNRKKLIPYAFLGTSFDYTLAARYIDASRTGGTPVTLQEEDAASDLKAQDQVADFNLSLVAGLGAKWRFGRSKVDFLTLELRFDNSLFNYINADNRNLNQDVLTTIGHVEDDLALNTVSFSIGYIKSLYKPRKRKQYR